jgi:hypothetical protein
VSIATRPRFLFIFSAARRIRIASDNARDRRRAAEKIKKEAFGLPISIDMLPLAGFTDGSSLSLLLEPVKAVAKAWGNDDLIVQVG